MSARFFIIGFFGTLCFVGIFGWPPKFGAAHVHSVGEARRAQCQAMFPQDNIVGMFSREIGG